MQRETIGMLIHELTIAMQRDRERQLHATLATRRHLAQACLAAPRGVLARLRPMGRPADGPLRTEGHAHARIDPRSVREALRTPPAAQAPPDRGAPM